MRKLTAKTGLDFTNAPVAQLEPIFAVSQLAGAIYLGPDAGEFVKDPSFSHPEEQITATSGNFKPLMTDLTLSTRKIMGFTNLPIIRNFVCPRVNTSGGKKDSGSAAHAETAAAEDAPRKSAPLTESPGGRGVQRRLFGLLPGGGRREEPASFTELAGLITGEGREELILRSQQARPSDAEALAKDIVGKLGEALSRNPQTFHQKLASKIGEPQPDMGQVEEFLTRRLEEILAKASEEDRKLRSFWERIFGFKN